MGINIYIQTKIHKGNEAGGIRVVQYGQGGSVKAGNVTLYTGKESHFFIYNLTLRALREAYMDGLQNQPIQLMFIQKSPVRALKHLSTWEQQNWPVSKYDSKELYQQAKAQNPASSNGISLAQIPKNYADYALNDLQQIAKGIKHFPNGITFAKCDKSDDNHVILNNYLKTVVSGMPATTGYQKRVADRTQMTFTLSKELKAQFNASCNSVGDSKPKVLRGLMQKYISAHPAKVVPSQKSNSNPKAATSTVLVVARKIDRAISKSIDVRDFTIHLDRYGIIAHLKRHTRTNRLLRHARYTFVNHKGQNVTVSSRKLGIAYGPKSIIDRLHKNENALMKA